MQHANSPWALSRSPAAHAAPISPVAREVISKRGCTGFRWTGEPRISDLLADPITQALMSADRVKPEDVRLLLSSAVGG